MNREPAESRAKAEPARAGSVSVVIPCFNSGSMLAEAVQSVRACAPTSLLEIVVVNDGSTDGLTLRAVQEAEKCGCSVIHQENRGLGPARNTGIRRARGEYILTLDSDNRIRPPYFEEGVAILDAHPSVGVVYGNAWYFGEREGFWEQPLASMGELCCSNQVDACALFRKGLWQQLGGYDEHMPWMGYEDWDFWLRAALAGWEFRRLPQVAFDYRTCRDSMLVKVTAPNHEALTNYIFAKPELKVAKEIRTLVAESRRLSQSLAAVERGAEYRIGKLLLRPIRVLARLLPRQTGKT